MIQFDFTGQTAVITGGGRGIGYAVAERLIACGGQAALWDQDGARAAAAAERLGAMPVTVDIADYSAVAAALVQTEAALGPVSLCVNSAGVAGPNHSLDDYPVEDWAKVIDVNLNGTFHVNRAVVPGMKARNYGRICNVASIAGKEGNPRASAYSASKAGVIGLTKSLGKELADYDICVNCLTPVTVNTEMLEQVDQRHIDYMRSKIPKGRFLEVEEVAATICWMLSAENNFATGVAFDLSGGRATY